MKIRRQDRRSFKETIPAEASVEEAVKEIRQQAMKFPSPDITKMWGFKTARNPETWYFFKTKTKRDEKIKKFPGAKKINPKI